MTEQRSKLLEVLLDAPAHKIVTLPDRDYGLADVEPFPFLAIVGQQEMKLALTLSVINPRVGGVLLIGPRGTAKTTAVRAMTDLLPSVRRSLCVNGCTEKMLEEGGMDAICADCNKKIGYGESLTVEDRVRCRSMPAWKMWLVASMSELPWNSSESVWSAAFWATLMVTSSILMK